MKNRVIFLFLVFFSLIFSNSFAEKEGIEEGNKVIDFSITDITGKTVNSKDLIGKTIVLHFWASWCPPCKEELPEYNIFYLTNKDKKIEFITVSVDNSKKSLLNFLKNIPHSFDVYHDTDGLARTFLIRAIPTTYIINEKGIIVRKRLGSISWGKYSFETIKKGDF